MESKTYLIQKWEGYSEQYAKEIIGYKIEGLDTQRAYLSFVGQGNPFSLQINILGKKGQDYVWISTLLYDMGDFPQGLSEKLNSASIDDKIIEIYGSDPEVQNDIKSTATKLVKDFAIVK